MVKSLAVVGALCLLVMLMGAILPDTTQNTGLRLITVSGEAQLNVVPDEAIISIGTMAGGDTPSEARNKNAALAKKVIDVAKRIGIDSKYIQTDNLEIDLVKPEYYDWRACYDNNESKRYGARQMLRFTLKDTSKLEPLLTESLEAGAIKVLGVDFRTTKLRQYRDQAREKAIQAAKEKAVDMAAALGQKIGEPQKIDEQPYYGRDWYYYGSCWWGGGYSNNSANYAQNVSTPSQPSGSAGEVALGQIGVTARVSVSFKLE